MAKYYAETHEWVEIQEDSSAKIGISNHAQSELGDIVYITLPEIGTKVSKETAFCEVESVKSVSDVYAPVNGVVIAVNEDLVDHPELVNENAEENWLIQVNEVSGTDDLLTEEEYLKTI